MSDFIIIYSHKLDLHFHPQMNTGYPVANMTEWLESNLEYKEILSIYYHKNLFY